VTNVDSIWVFDIGGSYDINDTVRVRASIENVLEWDPSPVQRAVAHGPLTNYLGRVFNVGVTARF